MTVTVSVTLGTLSISDLNGVTILAGTDTNSPSITFSGTPSQANAALGDLIYTPASSGLPLSIDVLNVVVTGSSGLVSQVQINIFITRSSLGGVPNTLNIAALVPTGRTIASAKVTSWDPSQLSQVPTVASDGTLSFTAVNGQDGGVTYTSIVVHMVYSDGSEGDVTVQLTVYHPLLQTLTSVNSPAQLNAQTSLYEQNIRIVNTTPFPLVSFTVSVPNLPAGVLLESASGYDASGTPFIAGVAQLAPGASTTLILQYFSPNAQPFTSPAARLLLAEATSLPTPSGTVTPVKEVVTGYLGRTYLEFPSIAGDTYWVMYSDSQGATWQTSTVPVLGTGGPIFWMDSGPPNTSSVPPSGRIYQLLVSAP